MKKNSLVAILGTLIIASFVFSGISFKPTSLTELKAHAAFDCIYTGGFDDCVDPRTGFIIPESEMY